MPLQEKKIGKGTVRFIVIYYGDVQGFLGGIQMFDQDRNLLLETPKLFTDLYSLETIVERDEFIVGFKSRKTSEAKQAQHIDFQFLIARA